MTVHKGEDSQLVLSLSSTQRGESSPLRQCCRTVAWLPVIQSGTPSPWVARTIAMGYRLQFRVKPPRFISVVNTIVGNKAAGVLREEINTLLEESNMSCYHFRCE